MKIRVCLPDGRSVPIEAKGIQYASDSDGDLFVNAIEPIGDDPYELRRYNVALFARGKWSHVVTEALPTGDEWAAMAQWQHYREPRREPRRRDEIDENEEEGTSAPPALAAIFGSLGGGPRGGHSPGNGQGSGQYL